MSQRDKTLRASNTCRWLLLVLWAVCMPTWAEQLMPAPSEWRQAEELRRYDYSLTELGFPQSVLLRGSESSAGLSFGSRLDELVEEATLDLGFSFSPSLVPHLSHLKVYLNGEFMSAVAVDPEKRLQQKVSIPLNTRYLADFNQVRVQLVGQPPEECYSPDSPSIWAELTGDTRLRTVSRVLPVANNLQQLPAPFFDRRDYRALQLPVVLTGEASLERLHAAGIVTSWFGALASWRGASFPVETERLPRQHALVFMTNTQRPKALQDFPPVSAPTLQMISHPENPAAKLLLIQGRDDADLVQAARGLVLGSELLSGPVAEIQRAVQSEPRKPYDAPNWLPTDRPVRFGELVDNLNQLQVEGRTPPPVRVGFQLPPDLFTWRSRGIPVELDYRYSPPVEDGSGSQMSLSINEQFIEAFNLTRKGFSGEAKRFRVPLLNDGFLSANQRLRIPAFKVGSRNQLEFKFDFAGINSGECKSLAPAQRYAVVDADSTVDFTGFAHYIEMPNLRAFANAAYPFTRMADLSETAVLLPDSKNKEIVQTYLQLMGFAGASSGYPALAMTLYDDWQEAALKDRDVLLIAANGQLAQGGEDLPLLFDRSERMLQKPRKNIVSESDTWAGAAPTLASATTEVEVRASGPFAALLGMRSPYNDDRSVVAVLAAHPGDMAMVREALADSGKIAEMYGSVVVFREGGQASFNVGDKYYVGKLRVWDLIWYHFSRYPMLLGIISIIVVLMLAVVLWRLLSGVARRRLQQGDE